MREPGFIDSIGFVFRLAEQAPAGDFPCSFHLEIYKEGRIFHKEAFALDKGERIVGKGISFLLRQADKNIKVRIALENNKRDRLRPNSPYPLKREDSWVVLDLFSLP